MPSLDKHIDEAPEELEFQDAEFEEETFESSDDLLHSPAGSLATVRIRRKKRRPATIADGAAKPIPISESVTPAPVKSRPRTIYDYWDELRHGRRFPRLSEINIEELLEQWPGSLILKIDPRSHRAEVDKSVIMRQRNRQQASGVAGGAVQYAPMMVQWVVSLGTHVAKTAMPVQEREVFPIAGRDLGYHIWVLPLGEDQSSKVDHALCGITRTPDADEATPNTA